jgi:glycosyltransferase involved in cell wall biosynthesis
MNALLPAQVRGDESPTERQRLNPLEPPSIAKPLRIALLGYRSHPHVGGQGIYLKYVSRALCDLGHQVDVLSGPPYPELDPRVRLISIPSLDLYAVFPNHIRALRWRHLLSWTDFYEWSSMATGGFAEPYTFGRRVVDYLREHRNEYDIIHDNQSLCYGLLTLQKQGWPVIATIHHPITRDRQLALDSATSESQKWLIRRWYGFLKMQSWVVPRLRHIVTVSETSRRDIASEFKCEDTKIAVIGNGIDTGMFCPQPQISRCTARILTTTSSDQPLKGFAVLINAFAQVQKHVPEAELHVIGTLQPNGHNARLLDQLQIRDMVHFKSGLSDQQLVEEYAHATLAVCPSLYEGFGLPAAEAMSCGVPLVSSNGGALAEVVGDGGLLVPAGDSDALAQAIVQVLTQPALAAHLSKAGRSRVEREYCWQRVAARLSDYYWQCLNSKPTAQLRYAND